MVLPAVPDQIKTTEPYQWELTAEGRQDPLLKLSDDPAESQRIWQGLPGMHWNEGVDKAKPGATVLVVNSARSNAFGKRVYSVHLKDVKDKTQFTELGLGDMRLVELFRALKKLDYQGITALEYEEHETEPGRYVEMCLAGARDAIGKM